MAQAICPVAGCARPVRCREWCNLHYQRWLKYGTADYNPPTESERFWSKVDKNGPGGCWLWTASLNNRGYGRFGPTGQRKLVRAHRWAYEAVVGPIPDGLVIDHLCGVKRCVNPAHLEPVTNFENLRRAGCR